MDSDMVPTVESIQVPPEPSVQQYLQLTAVNRCNSRLSAVYADGSTWDCVTFVLDLKKKKRKILEAQTSRDLTITSRTDVDSGVSFSNKSEMM